MPERVPRKAVNPEAARRSEQVIKLMVADCRGAEMRSYIDGLTPKMLSVYREPKIGRARDLEHLGTGMLFYHRERHFAVLAAHELDSAEDYNLGVFRTTPAADNIVLPRVRYTSEKPGGHRDADRIDIGVVPLSSEHVAFFGVANFLTVADCDLNHTPVVTSLYTAFGYPNRRNEPIIYREPNIKPSRFTYSQAGATPERYREVGVSPATHVAFKIDPDFAFSADGTQNKPPKRVGMSGGACIHFHDYRSLGAHLLARRPKIVGVVIENPDVVGGTLLVATKIRYVFEAIEQFLNKYPNG